MDNQNARLGHQKTIVMAVDAAMIKGFERWMQAIGYASSTVSASARYAEGFFFYLKKRGKPSLEEADPNTINAYHKYLQSRSNKRRGGGLSKNYIASNINALKRLGRYLQETGKGSLEISLKPETEKMNANGVLNQEEVRKLYRACSNTYLGIRDRAMLAVFYGCGLRRSEGLALDVQDVMLRERKIYVRQGKGNKERYVPMANAVRDDLEHYIKTSREKLQSFKPGRQRALFLSMQSKRLCGNALIGRVHKLAAKASLSKEIGLHALRHSIATHLLESGLELEEVSRFLGHSSLESTQIYTHIINGR